MIVQRHDLRPRQARGLGLASTFDWGSFIGGAWIGVLGTFGVGMLLFVGFGLYMAYGNNGLGRARRRR